MYWIDEKKGILARAKQLDENGIPYPGQEHVPDDDPRVIAAFNPPERPPRITIEEVVAALGTNAKAMALKERLK